MKKHKIQALIIFLFFTVICAGCRKEKISKKDVVVFGTFYGECAGEQCIEIFKLENEKLYEDSIDKYPNSSAAYNGNFNGLSNSKYNLVKDIVSKIPDSLYLETEHVIGQPDAGDWGGIYFEINKNDKQYYWLIDTQTRNLPKYLHSFSEEIMEAVSKLK